MSLHLGVSVPVPLLSFWVPGVFSCERAAERKLSLLLFLFFQKINERCWSFEPLLYITPPSPCGTVYRLEKFASAISLPIEHSSQYLVRGRITSYYNVVHNNSSLNPRVLPVPFSVVHMYDIPSLVSWSFIGPIQLSSTRRVSYMPSIDSLLIINLLYHA